MSDGQYYIEFHAIGNSVKVSAVDPVTLEEVSIISPSHISRHEMEKVAIKKLEYVKRKNAEKSAKDASKNSEENSEDYIETDGKTLPIDT
ncbi:hypothetical protein N9W34_03630 [Rickettsiales bacterium]|nr:hypothetical protein [Rickettsiales bacterium]